MSAGKTPGVPRTATPKPAAGTTPLEGQEARDMARAKRAKKRMSGGRAVPHVRQFLGQRLRTVRKQRGLNQTRLGELSSLSGKFIGEVERGDKSISIDSLYKVSVALQVPLGHLADVPPGKRATVPSQDAEKIFALVSGRRRPAEIRKAYEMLRRMLDQG